MINYFKPSTKGWVTIDADGRLWKSAEYPRRPSEEEGEIPGVWITGEITPVPNGYEVDNYTENWMVCRWWVEAWETFAIETCNHRARFHRIKGGLLCDDI